MPATALTVRDLRRKWKLYKERLGSQPTAIRFHRACSWLDRAQTFDVSTDADFVLINQWIAFNALYGRWDPHSNEPCPDRESWRIFVSRILQLDGSSFLSNILTENKPLVLTLLEDEYLAAYFWKEPTPQSKQQARNQKQK